jgi:hypothetical protein
MAKQAQNKTLPTAAPVQAFLDALTDPQQRADSEELIRLMGVVTGEPPTLWGPSIVGFGSYHYRYDSGREGDVCALGFSPRKGQLSLYLFDGVERHGELLSRLGPYKTGKSCLYIKRLADVDPAVLEQMLRDSYNRVRAEVDTAGR